MSHVESAVFYTKTTTKFSLIRTLSLSLPLYVSLYIPIALFSKNLFAIIQTRFVTRNNTGGCATLAEKASIIFRY